MTDTTAEFTPVRSGLMSSDPEAGVSLLGSRCRECGETTLGANDLCPNCGSDDVSHLPLSDHGQVWTYTIIRYRPPGDYKGAEPFAPYAIGLVELPEGLRVLAPIRGDLEKIRIGMPVTFDAFRRADGVTEFGYQPQA